MVVTAVVLCAALILLFFQSRAHGLPATIPRVGRRDEVFSTVRAHLRDRSQGLQTFIEGYTKVKSELT